MSRPSDAAAEFGLMVQRLMCPGSLTPMVICGECNALVEASTAKGVTNGRGLCRSCWQAEAAIDRKYQNDERDE